MTPYELIELLKNDANTPSEVIQIVNDLIGEIDSDPRRYLLRLSEEIEDYSRIHELCPLCGSELITIEHTEDRGEYQGFNCEEVIYSKECSECSYIAE